jgi:hypothetical protein
MKEMSYVKAQDVETFKRKLLEMRRDLLGQVERKKLYSKRWEKMESRIVGMLRPIRTRKKFSWGWRE